MESILSVGVFRFAFLLLSFIHKKKTNRCRHILHADAAVQVVALLKIVFSDAIREEAVHAPGLPAAAHEGLHVATRTFTWRIRQNLL